jgi:pyruvate,water dikinase
VKRTLQRLIKTAHDQGRKVGICGQAPSDYPEFTECLAQAGIDAMSLNPDSVIQVKQSLADQDSHH